MHDNNVKPNLIFRSIDIDDELEDYNPNENLTDMLNSDLEDQYLNVRKSLTRLFDKIQCIPTYALDKKDKAQLKLDNFINFMSNESNGFKSLCDQLNEQVPCLPSYNFDEFVHRAGTIVQQINSNQNIDFRIFDLTSSQAYIAIRKWEDEIIDNNKFNEIQVDGTQSNWDANIVPVINYRDEILKQFDNLFNLTTPSVRKENRERIKEKFDTVIFNAQTKSLELSNTALELIYTQTILNQTHQVVFDPSQTFSTWSATVLTPILNQTVSRISNTPYLEENKSQWENKTKSKFETKSQVFKQTHNNIKVKLAEYIDSQCGLIKGFLVKEQTDLLSIQAKDILISFSSAVNKILTKFEEEIIFKLGFQTEKCEWNLAMSEPISKIPIDFANINVLDEIIVGSQARSKKLSQLNSYVDGMKTMKLVIELYLLDVFEEKFNRVRLSLLSDALVARQIDYHQIQYSLTDWVKFKQFHQNHHQLYEQIVGGNNNVSYLNLFSDINKYMEINPSLITSVVKPRCLVRYMYLVNNTDLFNIYETDDFEEKFKHIIPIYKQLQTITHPNPTDTAMIRFEFVTEIVNILFQTSIGTC